MGNLRLLSKSEIERAKNSDKSKEIAEGLKISRRVDGLRELQAQEEQALGKFREKTLEEINKEITEAIKERDEVLKEIHIFRKEINDETTLSKEERHNLEKLKERLETKEGELLKKEESVNLLEIDIAIALKNAKDDAERQRSHKEAANDLHKKAEQFMFETKTTLEKARTIETNAIDLQKEKEEYFINKENDIKKKEQAIAEQIQNNSHISNELAKEKIRLADQRATLERALERIKKNRLY